MFPATPFVYFYQCYSLDCGGSPSMTALGGMTVGSGCGCDVYLHLRL